jgi:hypothetical protein
MDQYYNMAQQLRIIHVRMSVIAHCCKNEFYKGSLGK